LSTKTAKQLARRVAEQRQRWASGGLAKTIRRKNKSGGTVELESRQDLAMATPQRVSLFIPQQKRNGHPNRLR
jgi:hypothetical protein